MKDYASEALLTEGFQYLAASLSAVQKGLVELTYADMSISLKAAHDDDDDEDRSQQFIRRSYRLYWDVDEPVKTETEVAKPALYLPE